jgi:hypothetical protein
MSSKLNKAIVHRMEDLRDVDYGREDIHIGGTHHEPHIQKQYGTADEDSVHDYESMQSSPNEDHERVSFTGGIAPKAVYKSKKTGRKFLVKAYHFNPDGRDSSAVGDGFGESLIADMYRSAGIGHLIQRTHISNGKAQDLDTGGKKDMPLLVVHMEPHSVTADNFTDHSSLTHAEIHSMHPDKMKIEAMDYITGNSDRHSNNIMLRLDPHTGRPHSLMAIDNNGFSYFDLKGREMMGWGWGFKNAGFKPEYDEVHAHEFVNWWRKYSPMIRLAFHRHIPHVKRTDQRDEITMKFDDRCARLDRIADHYLTTGEWKKVD